MSERRCLFQSCYAALAADGLPIGGRIVRVPAGSNSIVLSLHPLWGSVDPNNGLGPALHIVDADAILKPDNAVKDGWTFTVQLTNIIGMHRLRIVRWDERDHKEYKNSINDVSDINGIFAVYAPPVVGGDLNPQEISLVTVINKWIGPPERWPQFLKSLGKNGSKFNMVHFTPLQRRGASNSPYSLFDHLELDGFDNSSWDNVLDAVSCHDSNEFQLRHQRIKEAVSYKQDYILNPALGRLDRLVNWMKRECHMHAMIDVVWNHVSNDAPFLREHPESGYSLENTPALHPAFELDFAIKNWSKKRNGLTISSRDELNRLINDDFIANVLQPLRLWEYFVVCNIDQLVTRTVEYMVRFKPSTVHQALVVHNSGFGSRAAHTISEESLASANIDIWEQVHTHFQSTYTTCRDLQTIVLSQENLELPIVLSAIDALRHCVDEINVEFYTKYDKAVEELKSNIFNRVFYERLDINGLRLGAISDKCPILQPYFSKIDGRNGETVYLVNNGWVWDGKAGTDYAEDGMAYLTRSVVVWEDCVKLRYGKNTLDAPALWDMMETYTLQMAQIFDAFRIDNCHATPPHVARHMISLARASKPNIWIVAELFTGDDNVDEHLSIALGLDALVREAMVPWDAAELVRQLQLFGGNNVDWTLTSTISGVDQLRHIALHGESVSYGPATLYMDCTHDNETPSQKRSYRDTLSTAALVAFCSCAVGTVVGVDDFYPERLDIVKEKRLYSLERNSSMQKIRAILNEYHLSQSWEGQRAVHFKVHSDGIVIAHSVNFLGIENILIAHTAFKDVRNVQLDSLVLDDIYDYRVLAEASVDEMLHCVEYGNETLPVQNAVVQLVTSSGRLRGNVVNLHGLTPGSIVMLACKSKSIPLYEPQHRAAIIETMVAKIQELSFIDVNELLFQCQNEVFEPLSNVYIVPQAGPLPYSGVAGFLWALQNNGFKHELRQNLALGPWAIEYVIKHIASVSKPLAVILQRFVQASPKASSSNLRPEYFATTTSLLYRLVQNYVWQKSNIQSRLPGNCSVIELALVNRLLTASMEFVGRSRSGMLLCPEIIKQHKLLQLFPDASYMSKYSMSAGLPHFSSDHMRVWGRDVFIALPGLLIATGRLFEARAHILAFASCAANGCIPNLLDACRRPRFNSRDASWWFIRAVRLYCQAIDNPGQFLARTKVPLRFPRIQLCDYIQKSCFQRPSPVIWLESFENGAYSQTMTLIEIIQEIVAWHAYGIHFCEWRAGPDLDEHMKDEGFSVDILLDPDTGLVSGGNASNCGTWMDKMGSSGFWNTRGIPVTPRDGAAIEIQALVYDAITWLSTDPAQSGKTEVILSNGSALPLVTWAERLKRSITTMFLRTTNTPSNVLAPGQLIYYADTAHSDQLRPNYVVAMSLAPSLFELEEGLLTAKYMLLGKYGLQTLEKGDAEYTSIYRQQHDRHNAKVSDGSSYHQGPEWPWLLGCYIKCCKLVKWPVDELEYRIAELIESSQSWLSVPEIFDGSGLPSPDGCSAQAWSVACILEAIVL